MPQPVTTSPIDWSQNAYVQVEGGFITGLLLGAVPFAGVGHGLLDAAGVLAHGTPEARMVPRALRDPRRIRAIERHRITESTLATPGALDSTHLRS